LAKKQTMLPSQTPPGGAKLHGFFVDLPTINEKIDAINKGLSEGKFKKDRKKEFEEERDRLIELLNMAPPPPPPLPKFKLTGNLPHNIAVPEPPSFSDKPSIVPRKEWGLAQRMFMVVYGRVAVRAQPNLRAERIDVIFFSN
jgi:hypothetical protein